MATILVLDTNPDSRRLFQRSLERVGHEVISCDGRDQALELISARKPDLAIVNVDPGSRHTIPVGYLLREENRALRILVITDSLHEKCKEIVSDREVLFRPVELDTIEKRIRELLESAPQRDG